MPPTRALHHSASRSLLTLVTLVALSLALPGCLRGDALKIATIAAVVAVKTVQLAAASARHEGRTRVSTSGASYVTSEGGPCGVCPEPDNGYAICFVSTCEVRCIEGYVLFEGQCEPASASANPPETPALR